MIASTPLGGVLPAAPTTAPATPATDAPATGSSLFASLLGVTAPAAAAVPASPLVEGRLLEPPVEAELELPIDPLALLVWLPWMQPGSEQTTAANGADPEPLPVGGLGLKQAGERLPLPLPTPTPAPSLAALPTLPPAPAPLLPGVLAAVSLEVPPPAAPTFVLAESETDTVELPAIPTLPAPAKQTAQATLAALRADIIQASTQTASVERLAASAAADALDARSEPVLGSRTVELGPARATFELAMPAQTAQRSAADLGEAIDSRMQWMAERGIGRAQIRLSPAELGVIDIDLKMDGKQIRAEFVSNNADVRQMLESQLPRLRDMLQSHGMQLTDASVGQHKDAQAGHHGGGHAEGSHDWAGNAGEATELDGEAAVQAVLRQRDGLLDEYA